MTFHYAMENIFLWSPNRYEHISVGSSIAVRPSFCRPKVETRSGCVCVCVCVYQEKPHSTHRTGECEGKRETPPYCVYEIFMVAELGSVSTTI